MKLRASLALSVLAAAALAISPPLAAAITRDERQGIKAAIHKLADPAVACSRLTQRFLKMTYGADGPKGRKRCRRQVRHQLKVEPNVGLKKMRIVDATEDTARVRVVDTDGDHAVFILVKSPRGWLLDDAF